mgnify:CR=1 FL=1
MVRDIMGILEIFSLLYTFTLVYNKKFSINVYASVFTIAQLVLLSGINNHGFPVYLLSASYIMLFLYCILYYKSSVKRAIINCIITIIVIGLFQIMSYMVVSLVTIKMQNIIWKELIISILCFLMILISGKWLKLKEISDFLLQRKKILLLIGLFIFFILGKQIWMMKQNHMMKAQIVIPIIYAVLIMGILIYEWQKTRLDAERKRVQLEMNSLYFNTYEGLIMSIREKQHDFKNHLNAIEGMIYTTSDYNELVAAQRKYFNLVNKAMGDTSILTLVENPLIAGFLYRKVSEAKERQITVQQNCILSKNINLPMPEYLLVEIMGILIDNAIEAVTNGENDTNGRQIRIELKQQEKRIYFAIANSCKEETFNNIGKMFQLGYSEKGGNRGIGLAKLQRMIEDLNGEIVTTRTVLDNHLAIEFQIVV